MKRNKFYYHDTENDLTEYSEGNESTFAVWVNPYLTLMFPHGCEELIPKNIVGFQLNGMRHMLHKAEEQAKIPLTPEEEQHMEKILQEAGFKISVDENGDKIWKKNLDWEKNGHTTETSISTEQTMDADKGG